MKVFILAGGLGTRLRPVIGARPKALADVAGRPFLAWQIAHLRDQGFRHFVLCTGYRAAEIEACFGDGSALGVDIVYSMEPVPLGTAGALKHAARYVDGRFLALNGDTYFTASLTPLLRFHHAVGALATLGLARVDDASAYGRVELDARGRVRRFVEKDGSGVGSAAINAGVYVLEPAVLDHIPAGRPVSIEHETFPGMVAADLPLYGRLLAGEFIDMGTPEGYARLRAVVRGGGFTCTPL